MLHTSTTLQLLARALAPALLLAAAVPGGVVNVPGDVATLQAAIDGASAGDVIVISGGTHDAIVIDKPLNLVGVAGNEPLLQGSQPPVNPFNQLPAITLAGPGSGRVTLAHITVGGPACGSFYGSAAPGISGGGFSELALVECDVSAPVWEFLTGFGASVAAIDVTVPYIRLQSSTVTGGQPGTDFFWDEWDVPNASPAIDAPSSTVLVCDSAVQGGAGMETDYQEFACPPSCGFVANGLGGTGIVADTVYQAGGTISGGPGATITCETSGFLCSRPSGAPLAVPTFEVLPGSLSSTGAMLPGFDWTFTWFSSSSSVLLLLSAFPAAPVEIGNKGLLFMSPSPLFILGLPGGFGSADITAPADPCLAGFPLVLQLLDAGELSRPLYAILSGS